MFKWLGKGFHLSTTLVFTYFLVALLAVAAASSVALPLLQQYQNDQASEMHRREVLENGRTLDYLRGIMLSTNPKVTNPFRDLLLTNPSVKEPVNRVWPATPSLDLVRQKLSDLAQGRRLLVITDRDHEVKVDTENSPNLSLEGKSLPDVRIPANAATNPSPPETDVNTPDGQHLTLVFRNQGGATAPNLFGINTRGDTTTYILAIAVPYVPAKSVWGDFSLILGLAALVALAVSVLVGFWLARSLSRPLVRLTRATEAVAQGDYEQQVAPQGGYELNHLAQSFNQMTRAVAESQRMQRQLIANVSHELKTPLTSIRGFSQAMLDGALRRPEDYARPAEIISKEADRMIRLVNNLLDLSKLESGQLTLQRREFDLAELLKYGLESFSPQAEEAAVSLVKYLSGPLRITGDPDRLRQVFNNLIDNALQYTPAGGKIAVRGETTSAAIVITVSDSGSGISPDDLPHIFERFYRSDKSRRRDEGSGLGLAISKEIVQAHGGKIEVSSQPGQGTTFTITLPPAQTIPAASETTARRVEIGGELAPRQ